MRRRHPKPLILTAAFIMVAGMVAWLGFGEPLRSIRTAILLAEIAAGPGATETPSPVTATFAMNGDILDADIYRNGNEGGPGLVLVPGAVRAGKDDLRLRVFAGALARAGFTVMVPDIPNLRRLRVGPEDAPAIAAAARHLSEQTGGPVGIAALSYAVGPAILTAIEPGSGPPIAFIVGIGGYHDLRATLTYMTTGYARAGPDAPWVKGNPNPYGKWIFVRANADRLSLPDERQLMARIADTKLRDPAVAVDAATAGLGPEGRAVMALLDNADPERVGEHIASLPAAIRNDIEALDLAQRDLSAMTASLILVHGRDDPIIPHGQSVSLARAAGKERAVLYSLDHLNHVDLEASTLADAWALWRAIHRLLGERDRINNARSR